MALWVKNPKYTMKNCQIYMECGILNFRSHLINVIRDHGVHLDVGAAIGKLYKTHPELLPVASDQRSWLATSVVKLLAGYR